MASSTPKEVSDADVAKRHERVAKLRAEVEQEQTDRETYLRSEGNRILDAQLEREEKLLKDRLKLSRQQTTQARESARLAAKEAGSTDTDDNNPKPDGAAVTPTGQVVEDKE